MIVEHEQQGVGGLRSGLSKKGAEHRKLVLRLAKSMCHDVWYPAYGSVIEVLRYA